MRVKFLQTLASNWRRFSSSSHSSFSFFFQILFLSVLFCCCALLIHSRSKVSLPSSTLPLHFDSSSSFVCFFFYVIFFVLKQGIQMSWNGKFVLVYNNIGLIRVYPTARKIILCSYFNPCGKATINVYNISNHVF
jgi:hypothetical protein